jgi:hypothetical protein
MSETIIRSSGLFPQVEAKGQMPGVKAYGTLIIEGGSGELNVADIGVSYGLAGKALQSNPITAYFRLLYRALLKPLFNSRVESAMFNFRGMFCWAKLNKALPARILILPDHLEDKIGFLAHSVQALRPGAGERLVKLEDSEFERYFAVYADDEVAARYILTPLVMRRLTELREHFRQDLMLSVGGRGFYFAAPMSDGFFCLRGNALKDRNIAGRIYFGINIVRAIFTQLTDFPGNQ